MLIFKLIESKFARQSWSNNKITNRAPSQYISSDTTLKLTVSESSALMFDDSIRVYTRRQIYARQNQRTLQRDYHCGWISPGKKLSYEPPSLED